MTVKRITEEERRALGSRPDVATGYVVIASTMACVRWIEGVGILSITPVGDDVAATMACVPDLPLMVAVGDKAMRVVHALVDVAPGTTVTYGELARRAGLPRAARFVGNVVGANPHFYLIPCHRVVPASGGTGNYGWGPELKARLLAMESEGAMQF